MSKYTIVLMGLAFSAVSFGAQFKAITEQKFYTQDGVQKFSESYIRLEQSLKSKGTSSFKYNINNKTISAAGKVMVNVSHDGGEMSSETVKTLNGIFSNCSLHKGEIEKLTIKAGVFDACKLTASNVTSWYIEGFPFNVKRVTQDADGLGVIEAIRIVK